MSQKKTNAAKRKGTIGKATDSNSKQTTSKEATYPSASTLIILEQLPNLYKNENLKCERSIKPNII